MSGIDDRIVSLRFDNAQFEAKVAETMRSLDKLNANLNMRGATQGMTDLDAAAKKVDLTPLATSTEGLSAKFIAMSTVAITALSQITSKAISAGAQITKSLTIAPVMDGFREYETNMNSIQTILSNTKADGSTLGDVNSALDQLNHYSDQTIYNFSEMARNIGTFTAAGVGLDQSVNAIKGIANLAAISGSNSNQASTAMYQLSQALAAGKVNLMDWNSVVNAGMGGEVFKKALFETGKAMGTINDVPLGATFEEWEEKGGTFRDQMQKGWLTADVLSTTLEAFSGDLNQASLEQLGFSKEAAARMVELGKDGIAAATEVKTFSQLMSTVKESIGSGWSESFRNIIGDFEGAKGLFTRMNNYIGGVVGGMAEQRNQMLSEWNTFGGRWTLIESLRTAGIGLLAIFTPIKEAFRSIFPRKTGADLVVLTARFSEFTKKLIPSGDTMAKIGRIALGLFSAIRIGFDIFKGVAGVIKNFVSAVLPAGGGLFTFAANLGLTLSRAQQFTLSSSSIAAWFESLNEKIQPAIDKVRSFANTIKDFLGPDNGNIGDATIFGGRTDPFGLKSLGDSLDDAREWIREKFGSIRTIISDFGAAIGDALSGVTDEFDGFGDKVKGNTGGLDFDKIFNAGLFVAVVLGIRKVTRAFANLLDSGTGFVEGIQDVFGGLTDTLEAMQLKLKAEALQKIAIAVGILTASVVALSLIDADALGKALTAMSVGFGQIVAVMVVLTKIDATGAKMTAFAASMTLMAGSMILLSIAVAIMAQLEWEELGKGLAGVAGGMLIMSGAMYLMSGNTAGMVRAGIGILAISAAMIVLSYAFKAMAEMEWGEMAKGLVGVAGGLGAIALATSFMPKGMITKGLGVLIISAALLVLAEAVKSFSTMDFGTMMKGMYGVALSLGAIAIAVNAMPLRTPLVAVGVLMMAAAMKVMVSAVKDLAAMDLDKMAQGLAGVAALLVILAVATNAMTSAIMGAVSIVIVAGALRILADVMVILGQMSLGQIGGALLAIAGVLVVLGLAAAGAIYVLPGLIAMAIAIPLIGAGFLMMGAGALFAAQAMQIFADSGPAALTFIQGLMTWFITQIPFLATQLAISLDRFLSVILEALPGLIEALQEVLSVLIDALIELVPKLGELIRVLLYEIVEIFREHIPHMVEAGAEIIQAILDGLNENIESITEKAIEIVTKFLDVLSENSDQIVQAGVRFITSFLGSIADQTDEIALSAANLVISFLAAIEQQIDPIAEAGAKLVISFLTAIQEQALSIVEAGANLFMSFLWGVASKLFEVTNTVLSIVMTFIYEMGLQAVNLTTAGTNALIKFLEGISTNLWRVLNAATEVVTEFITGLIGAIGRIVEAGAKAAIKFINGIEEQASGIITAGANAVIRFMQGIAQNASRVAEAAFKVAITFINSLTNTINNNAGPLRAAGRELAYAIANGLTGGLVEKVASVARAAADLARSAWDAAMNVLEINSPSKVFMRVGGSIGEGLALGIQKDKLTVPASEKMAQDTVDAFRNTFKKTSDKLVAIGTFTPTITPVLDLSNVESEASRLAGMIGLNPIVPLVSASQADYLRHTTDGQNGSDPDEPKYDGPETVIFEQHNHSPKALSTGDIYRSTKSVVALAKEELFK